MGRMRRREREITQRDEIDAILARETICRVAFAVDGAPYLVPLSYGYDPEHDALVLHTADEGKKIDCIAANPQVCFEIEGPSRIVSGGGIGCVWGLEYESVIGYGTISEVIAPDDKCVALRCLLRQQAGRDMKWTFDDRSLEVTRVWRLKIESVTGKRAVSEDVS
jgi:hypothetical protein